MEHFLFFRLSYENDCKDNSTCHYLTLQDNITSSFVSPYGMFMYTNECPKQLRALDDKSEIKLLSDGKLYIASDTHIEIYMKGFCLENFYNPNTGNSYLSGFLCKTENLSLYLPLSQASTSNQTGSCSYEQSFERLHRYLRMAFTFCGIFSLPFLCLTLFFYITLPELGNFQGNIICLYIISTLLTTVFLTVNYNIRVSSGDLEQLDNDSEFFFNVTEPVCQAMGYLLYCSGLLMFTWMSVLCFDLMR